MGKAIAVEKSLPPASVAKVWVVRVNGVLFAAAGHEIDTAVFHTGYNPEFLDTVRIGFAIRFRRDFLRTRSRGSAVFCFSVDNPIAETVAM